MPVPVVAAAVLQANCFEYNSTEVESFIKKMVHDGSRYRNIEQSLGHGASLVLGTNTSESFWAKLLPKQGEKFEDAMSHLRSTQLPGLALKYSQLRIVLLKHRLGQFDSAIQAQPREPLGASLSSAELAIADFSFGELVASESAFEGSGIHIPSGTTLLDPESESFRAWGGDFADDFWGDPMWWSANIAPP